jgi:hypothetical protein
MERRYVVGKKAILNSTLAEKKILYWYCYWFENFHR